MQIDTGIDTKRVQNEITEYYFQRIFTEFMDDNHRPPDIDRQNYSFWIGYNSLYNDQEIITEGVSMSWNTL